MGNLPLAAKDREIEGLKILRAALGIHGVKVKRQLLKAFIQHIQKLAPWFPETNSIDSKDWERIGSKFGKGVEDLPPEFAVIYNIIKLCIEDKQIQEKFRLLSVWRKKRIKILTIKEFF